MQDQRELDSHVHNLKQECRKVGQGVQPFPAIIGQDDDISSFIWVNDEQIKLDSPIVAFDSCFKLYHALHAEYPCQASYSWLFVQQAMYGLETKWDFDAPSVATAVKKFKDIVLS